MAVTMKDYSQWKRGLYPPAWVENDYSDNAAIETEHGLVFAFIYFFDDYSQVRLVSNGVVHVRVWNKAWGRKTMSRLAREFAEEINNHE